MDCTHDSKLTSDLICKFKPMRNVIGKISLGVNFLKPVTKLFVSEKCNLTMELKKMFSSTG
jgi:hypothetical protein